LDTNTCYKRFISVLSHVIIRLAKNRVQSFLQANLVYTWTQEINSTSVTLIAGTLQILIGTSFITVSLNFYVAIICQLDNEMASSDL